MIAELIEQIQNLRKIIRNKEEDLAIDRADYKLLRDKLLYVMKEHGYDDATEFVYKDRIYSMYGNNLEDITERFVKLDDIP